MYKVYITQNWKTTDNNNSCIDGSKNHDAIKISYTIQHLIDTYLKYNKGKKFDYDSGLTILDDENKKLYRSKLITWCLIITTLGLCMEGGIK